MKSLESEIKFAVLLATHNGNAWIEEQLFSIIKQINVSVTVFVSDDMSEDGTFEKISSMVPLYENIKILPRKKHGTPARNFHYLLGSLDFSNYDYVALSDQDDIWFKDKLFEAHSHIASIGADAFSSDVIAQYVNGKRKSIKRSFPLKKYDYLFESAGAGCTYVIKACYISDYAKFIELNYKIVNQINSHDWTIYAYMRSLGYNWFIGSKPSVIYRQHLNNAEGVNIGITAYLNRFKDIMSGRYRKKCLSMLILLDSENTEFIKLLDGKWVSGLLLLKYIPEIRRSRKYQLILASFLLFGLFR